MGAWNGPRRATPTGTESAKLLPARDPPGPEGLALIRLDPGVDASPQMCHFGGPTGTNDDRTSSATVLNHFGNGVGVGRGVLPARSALAIGMPNPDHVYAQGAVVPGDPEAGSSAQTGAPWA